MKLITDKTPGNEIIALSCQLDDFDFNNPPFDPLEVGKEMIKIMYEHNGLGLAANQIGLIYRMFVMRGTTNSGDFICINPRLVHTSEEQVTLEESCLSYPGLVVKIKRPRHCRIRFALPDGNIETCQFTGMTARVVQHEIDHLNGVLFFSRANRYHRDLGFKNRGKYVLANNQALIQAVSPFDFQSNHS